MKSDFPPGRGSQLTPDERRDVQRLRLVDGESISEIARRTGRNRETIANIVRSDDTRELAEQLESESREAALRVLRGTSEQAARAWRKAIDTAADKGDHRPARDILLHNGVIQPLNGPANIGIQVIVGTPGHPAGLDPFDTVDITPRGDKP
ncbi:MAG: helix-turn-helix domain-containing protein [Acidobacteriota bacterium]|nr:helix-turn-helix domain-containing protein [Acidobacteriota bacterium]